MAPPTTDEELMQRTGRGDQQAFTELVRRHHGGLYGFFRRRGLDRHAAEDCVQDALLRLLRASDTYRPVAPFGAFLVRLARNTLIDCRRRRREDEGSAEALHDRPAAGEIEARAGLSAGDRLDLAQAIGGLSDKLRAVVELSVRDGLNHVEIARLLGLPHNTVKTRMHWAVRKLRERMHDGPERNLRHARRAERAGEAPPAGLAERVLATAQPELRRLRARRRRRRMLGTALAGTLLGALLFALRLERPGASATGIESVAGVAPWRAGTELIAAHLMPDGRFDSQSWSGPAGAEVGMHALALLALARGDESLDAGRPLSPVHHDELLLGANWLLERQDPGGALGAPGAGNHDHALATLALLAVYDRTGDDWLLAGTRAAVTHLARNDRPGRSPWELAALERAHELDVAPDLQPAIARTRARLGVAAPGPLATLGRAGDFGELPAAAASVLNAVASAH